MENPRRFMNGLVHEGVVLLRGSFEGNSDVMLIIRAGHAEQIMNRLAAGPWSRNGLLSIGSCVSRLGSRSNPPEEPTSP